jgi:hypothetical protein
VSRQQLASVQVTLDISYQEIPKLPILVNQIKKNIVDELATTHSEDALVMVRTAVDKDSPNIVTSHSNTLLLPNNPNNRTVLDHSECTGAR